MAPTAGAPTYRARAMMSASRATAMMTADSARAGGPNCPRRCRRRRRRRGAVVSHAHPRPLRVGTTPAQPPRHESCRRHPSAVRRMARQRPRFQDGVWRGGQGGVRLDAKSPKYVGERGGHARYIIPPRPSPLADDDGPRHASPAPCYRRWRRHLLTAARCPCRRGRLRLSLEQRTWCCRPLSTACRHLRRRQPRTSANCRPFGAPPRSAESHRSCRCHPHAATCQRRARRQREAHSCSKRHRRLPPASPRRWRWRPAAKTRCRRLLRRSRAARSCQRTVRRLKAAPRRPQLWRHPRVVTCRCERHRRRAAAKSRCPSLAACCRCCRRRLRAASRLRRRHRRPLAQGARQR